MLPYTLLEPVRKVSAWVEKMEHPVDHGGVDHVFTALARPLIVLAQPPVAAEPPKSALHNPAFGQQDKPCRVFRPLHDLQIEGLEAIRPAHQLAPVSLVGPELFQPFVLVHDLLDQRLRSRAIRDIGRQHRHREQQPEGVDDDVAFPARDLLAAIEAARPPFSVVLTVWLSIAAALGLSSRPAWVRTWRRRASCICSQTSSRPPCQK